MFFLKFQLEEEDNDENYVVGEQAMDRIARALSKLLLLPFHYFFFISFFFNLLC